MIVRPILVVMLLSVMVSCTGKTSDQDRTNQGLSSLIERNMELGKKPNRLIHEKSPYLLQHAFNPVDWYPWGEEAFSMARETQRPIFLSVGYSTCHWCHVMERESFENDSIAQIMNEYFVCIKVDREERPDVDKVYMTALQGMGQNGGWPMSMFLTPALKPFFGGTYFPPSSQYGRPGFPDILHRIHEVWEKERDKVVRSSEAILKALREVPSTSSNTGLDAGLLDTCFAQFQKTYDPDFGGFGGGPKFPRPSVFDFLLRYHSRTGNAMALDMTMRTLRKMTAGGIYDHVGGGFHRYSVDGEWRVPHFEKMLYDQAQIANVYLNVYQITRELLYASVAKEVLDYVLRDMTHPDGGFFSAEDADSPKPESPEEEGEGAFYLWTAREIRSVLSSDDAAVFCFYYGVEDSGNAPFDPQHEFTGKNILYIAHSVEEAALRFGKTNAQIAETLVRSRATLREIRSRRARPHLDDKILTSWNGLMISAFARAYQVLGERSYLTAAEQSARFVLGKMYDPSTGMLHRRYRDGEAKFDGHLDDYAFLVEGLLDLFESSFDPLWLEKAIKITQAETSRFWDPNKGGFFDTSGDDPSILIRMKEMYDGAEPSGNSIAAMNLLRLASVTDDAELKRKAERTLQSFGELLRTQPVVMPRMVCAYDRSLSKPKQIVIVGAGEKTVTSEMLRCVRDRYAPNQTVILIDGNDAQERLGRLNPFFLQLKRVEVHPVAYVCQNFVCSLPTSEVATVARLLDAN